MRKIQNRETSYMIAGDGGLEVSGGQWKLSWGLTVFRSKNVLVTVDNCEIACDEFDNLQYVFFLIENLACLVSSVLVQLSKF